MYRRLLSALVPITFVLGLFAAPVAAQSTATVADTVDSQGYYMDESLAGSLDADELDAIDQANDSCVGFVYLNEDSAEESVGGSKALEIADESDFTGIVLLYSDGVYAGGNTTLNTLVDSGPVFEAFKGGDIESGLEQIAEILGESSSCPASPGGVSGATSSSTESPAATATPASDSSSGGSIPWLLILLPLVLLFFFVRWIFTRRKVKAQIATDLEEDRKELREELADAADQVITLGDQVIASKDAELIQLYEEASTAYTEVSRAVDGAKTSAEIDLLDTKLDKAAWVLDVIDAKLKGETPPEPPGSSHPTPKLDQNALPQDRPVLGPDDSVFTGGSTRSARRGTRPSSRRRSSGMGGSILTSILMMLLNGYGGGSNRTRGRDTRVGRPSGGGGFGGGFGGGVLRPPHDSRGPGTYGGGKFGRRYGGGKF